MNTKEKIAHYIDCKGITKRDFYRQTGFSNGFLDSGEHIGTNNLKIIIDNYPDLSVEWLVFDKGPMLRLPEEHLLVLQEPGAAYGESDSVSTADNLDTILQYISRIKSMTSEVETLINAMKSEQSQSDVKVGQKSDKPTTKRKNRNM